MWSGPTRIGRYEIKGRIGGGGMGTLYLARDTNPTTDRLVTVKLLRASFDTEDLRQRFVREAQALAELNHPNIVTIHDSGEFEDSPFIVMEYVRGETLAESIKRRAPMSLGQKLRHLAELCHGLAHAHEAGIIHRDIKPANLMIDLHGRLKILDFGIARLDTGSGGIEGLTLVNAQIGTPGYMSPEQIAGGPVDGRSDIFSVGAVAYELISYREAFPGTTQQVSSIPGLDPELAGIIASALEKDVERRCQDAATLARAFDRVRARVGEEEVAPRMTPTPRPGGERRSRRDRAADVAFQRAVISHTEGAEGFARRSAMEALAEDPQHAEARRLLAELGHLRDVEPWLPTPPARPAVPAGTPQATAQPTPRADERTVLWQPAAQPPKPEFTVPSPAPSPDAPPDRTVLWRPAVAPPPGAPAAVPPSVQEPVEERTVVFPVSSPAAGQPTAAVPGTAAAGQSSTAQQPTAAPAPTAPAVPVVARTAPATPAVVQKTAPATPASGAKPTAASQAKTKPAAKTQSAGSGRTISPALIIVAAVVVLVVAGAVAYRVLLSPAAGGEVLTVTRPANGTIVSDDGVNCGSRGNGCSIARPRGVTVQLRALPDAGYVFSAFTGDCAAAGRTVMSAARTCGAVFSPMAAASGDVITASLPAEHLLTIDVPAGGTIEGAGIRCGTLGSQCTANQPAGTQVTLAAQPDANFTFVGFTGDCATAGTATMTEPRRCGATFAPAAATTPTEFVLTVTPPAGGTILGPGIKCGAGGTQCQSRQARGVAVTLTYEAEKSYKFVAFTGDCRATGRTRMVAARRCGATFAKEAAPPTPVLTIVRPTGGTLLGTGINCGTSGAQCSTEVAHGSTVVLRAQPDAGYKFAAFTGDCDANGATLMVTSRSCGATFAAAPTPQPATGARGWNTNLPDTRVTVSRPDANSVSLAFEGSSAFAGYTATLKGNGEKFTGEARRAGCDAPSRITLTASSPGVLVGQFELRACTGKSISKTGLVLSEKK